MLDYKLKEFATAIVMLNSLRIIPHRIDSIEDNASELLTENFPGQKREGLDSREM